MDVSPPYLPTAYSSYLKFGPVIARVIVGLHYCNKKIKTLSEFYNHDFENWNIQKRKWKKYNCYQVYNYYIYCSLSYYGYYQEQQ